MRKRRIVPYFDNTVRRLAISFRGSDGMMRFECDSKGQTLVFKTTAEARAHITKLEDDLLLRGEGR